MRFPTKTVIATALAATALSAPSANAVPVEAPAGANLPVGINGGVNPIANRETPRPAAAADHSSGSFDWADAGIGAAGMLAALGLGAGTLTITRRAQRRHAVTG
jgi:hypothetical protein